MEKGMRKVREGRINVRNENKGDGEGNIRNRKERWMIPVGKGREREQGL